MKLSQLVQVVPNSKDIHAPSRNLSDVEMSSEEFVANYADKGKAMQVSLNDDGISNPQTITAYVVAIPQGNGHTPGEVIISED
jgi:hypothetical protein